MRRSKLASTFIFVGALAAIASAATMGYDPVPAQTAGATVESFAALPLGTFK